MVFTLFTGKVGFKTFILHFFVAVCCVYSIIFRFGYEAISSFSLNGDKASSFLLGKFNEWWCNSATFRKVVPFLLFFLDVVLFDPACLISGHLAFCAPPVPACSGQGMLGRKVLVLGRGENLENLQKEFAHPGAPRVSEISKPSKNFDGVGKFLIIKENQKSVEVTTRFSDAGNDGDRILGGIEGFGVGLGALGLVGLSRGKFLPIVHAHNKALAVKLGTTSYAFGGALQGGNIPILIGFSFAGAAGQVALTESRTIDSVTLCPDKRAELK
jgi:hypothetical protein